MMTPRTIRPTELEPHETRRWRKDVGSDRPLRINRRPLREFSSTIGSSSIESGRSGEEVSSEGVADCDLRPSNLRHRSSTAPSHNQGSQTREANVDPALRIAAAIEQAITTVANNSAVNTAQIINKLTYSKDLPTFSGNYLEWAHFKRAYENCIMRGGYHGSEMMQPVAEALNAMRETW